MDVDFYKSITKPKKFLAVPAGFSPVVLGVITLATYMYGVIRPVRAVGRRCGQSALQFLYLPARAPFWDRANRVLSQSVGH